MLKAKAPINDITAVTRLRKSVATWSYWPNDRIGISANTQCLLKSIL
jgi:hypothetical protein